MRGRVLFFNKTYGFLRSDELREDIYFKYKDIVSDDDFKQVYGGDCVEFELNKELGKIHAINVRVIEEMEDGKQILKVAIFPTNKNSFFVEDFYKEIFSKIPEGLKFAKILDDKIIVTSKKVSDDIIDNIRLKKTIDDFNIKYINNMEVS